MLLARLVGVAFAVLVGLAGSSFAASPPPTMTVPGSFAVSPTGAATYSIPIQIPPGTSGVAPSLSLAYSSQNGDGIVGLGWALTGLPSITRCPRTLAQDGTHGSVNYDNGDRFCLGGQRLILINGPTHTYGDDGSEYRTEIESFSKVVAHTLGGVAGTAYFKVWTKGGQIMEFGNTPDSRVMVVDAATSSPTSTVREWAVSKISDVVQNYLTVTYNCAVSSGVCTDTDRTVNGAVYPLRVDYTGNSSAGVSPFNSVQFSYASRADTAPLYQAGGVIKLTKILTDVRTYQSSNLVYDYRLGYRSGTSTLRSHLTSVTQCDGSGTCPVPCSGSPHCLSSTTFGWQDTAATTFTRAGSPYTANFQVIPGDFNGDGLTDFTLLADPSALLCPPPAGYTVYLGQPTFGFSLSSSYHFQFPSGASSWPNCFGPYVYSTTVAPDGTANVFVSTTGFSFGPPVTTQDYYGLLSTAGYVDLSTYIPTGSGASARAGDLNGDGIIDFFEVGSPSSAYLGSPGGTFTPHTWSAAISSIGSSADFDGDGCADVVGSVGGAATVVYSEECHPATPTAATPSTSGFSSEVSGDFNGDGKTDFLLTDTTNSGQLQLSTGTAFLQISSATIPAGWVIAGVGDWNGDGKADLLVQTAPGADYSVYLSTGSDFTPALDGSGNPVVIAASAGTVAVVADWNNDGASDILLQMPFGSDGFVLLNYTPELMTSVSNGIGAVTNVAYTPINAGSPFYTKGTPATYPTQTMIGPQYVVSEVDASNGLGTCTPPSTTNCYHTTYTYTGAQKNLQGRGFLGFSQVVATDIQTGIVQTTNYRTDFPYVGLVDTQTAAHGATALNSTTNSYTNNSTCGVIPAAAGVYIDCLAQTVIVSNDLNGAALPTNTTAYTYDDYGDVLTANVTLSDPSTHATLSTKNTTNTYCVTPTCIGNWFLGRLLTTSVNSVVGSSNLTRQSSFAYDATTGLLTQESIEPGTSTCNGGSSSCTLTTSYTYDPFGHRATNTIYGTGVTTRTSYAIYGANGQFQTAAINALGQYETWTYDVRFGQPASHTGPNFLTTAWSYDAFGRPVLETRPDGTKTAQSYAYCSGGCPANGQFYGQSEMFTPSGTTQIGPVSTATYDMLSRSIATDSQGFDGSGIRVATVYDGNGHVQQTSRPYFAATAAPAWTSFTYDDLGRVTRATFPDTSHTDYGFNGLTTTVTNGLSQVTTTIKNAQGLTATVQDAATNTTTYVYDAFGDLLTVTDPASNAIVNAYDIRGNKISSHDPDMGNWTYAYDVLAELTSQVDAKGQTTTLTYDVLGRALTRTEPGLYSAWTYGGSAAAHNVGQLIEAKACTASACSALVSDRTFTFDGVGRQSTSVLRTPADTFGYRTTYDGINGQIASITYPSGFLVNRTYNSFGYLTAMTGSHGEAIWQANSRDAELHLTSETTGNGVITTQSYDQATGFIQRQRAGPGGAVASFDYAFDAIGNLTSRADNSQPFTERFCYDNLNRLTQYNIGAACSGGKTASYNAIGNITNKSDLSAGGTGNYSYSGAGPHAVSAISGTVDSLSDPKYSYDANGNLTCVSTGTSCSGTVGRAISLTSFNMAAGLTSGSSSLQLTYDDQHQRIRQYAIASGTPTETVYANDAASGAMSERVTTGSSSATRWHSFNWGAAPWGGTLPGAMPTFVDYITVDGQIVAQHTIQYQSTNAWGRAVWNSFQWGAPAGSLWGSTAPANPPRFKWGTDPWSGPVQTWSYFNLDHLGSIAVITDQRGIVIQRLSYDAWGKQRNANGNDAACGAISPTTTRGFTNQEQLPNAVACAVNLNARLYDSTIGRFMAADSIVGNPFSGQSFNRYTYVLNNPLSGTDPTGYLCDVAACAGGPEFNGLPDYHFGSSYGGTYYGDTDSSGRPTQYLSFAGSSTGANSVLLPLYYNGSPAGFAISYSPAGRLPTAAFQDGSRETVIYNTTDTSGSIEHIESRDVATLTTTETIGNTRTAQIELFARPPAVPIPEGEIDPVLPRAPVAVPRPTFPYPKSPSEPPGPGFEWRGNGPRGGREGNWYNPRTGESLHPDLEHPDPLGPHYDWKAPDGSWYRYFKNGEVMPKSLVFIIATAM